MPGVSWKKGARVYVHGRDLFGSVTEDQASDVETVLVKLDWPWDPQAPPEACDPAKLESEWDVRRRYE